MKFLLGPIAILFIFISIQSCQKNITGDAEPIVPPVITQHDSITHLTKVIYFDSGTSLTDTGFIYHYVYDGQQRVTGIIGYDYSSGSPILFEVETYFYNGTDTAAYKSTNEEVGTPSLIDTNFYFYDNLDRLIKDSILMDDLTQNKVGITNFTYSTNMITATHKSYFSGNPPSDIDQWDTSFIGTNGNIIKTIIDQPYTGRIVTAFFSYDNHPNPFYQLNIKTTYGPGGGIIFDTGADNVGKNNAVDYTLHDLLSPGSEYHLTFSYTYNASGLPEIINTSDDNGQSVYERLVLTY